MKNTIDDIFVRKKIVCSAIKTFAVRTVFFQMTRLLRPQHTRLKWHWYKSYWSAMLVNRSDEGIDVKIFKHEFRCQKRSLEAHYSSCMFT